MNSIFPDLRRYESFAIDTETTGNKWKDVPVGMSISTADGNDYYFAWGHEAGGNNCSLQQVRRWAKDQMTDPTKRAIFFEGMFDQRMLRKANIPFAMTGEDALIMCSLLDEYEPSYGLEALAEKYTDERKDDRELNEWCARAFGGKPTRKAQIGNYWRAPGHIVAPYAKSDTRATGALYRARLKELGEQDLWQVYWLECMLLPVLVKMYFSGVRVDVQRAIDVQADMVHQLAVKTEEWNKYGGFKFTARKKMIELFDRLNIQYPVTKKGNPSINKHFLQELDHPIGDLIRSMRQLEHYQSTFIQKYLLDNLDENGFIHPNFHSVRSARGGTITGRFSSAGGLNAQNIPARDEILAPLIRSMFIPITSDHWWLKADYSQIEYRFFAHYAGGNMRKAYNDDPDTDFHEFVMALTGLSRKPAKNTNFAKLYGAGIPKLALTIGCTEEEAARIVQIYDQKIPEAKRFSRKVMNRAAWKGYIITWGGRRLRFPKVGVKRFKYLDTHKALNKLLQGSSADLTKAAMVEVDRHIDWAESPMHLTVHDELDFSVPKGRRGLQIGAKVKEVMEDFDATVPIRAEVELGDDWGHCEPLEELLKAA